MFSIQFLGAAGTVTGSKYLISTDGVKVLVDCGMYQGLKKLRELNWKAFPFKASSLDAVVLTHAHLDHCGSLPRLVKAGFKGKILATPATIDLAKIILLDSGHLQEEQARYANKKGFSKHEPALALFTVDDAQKVFPHFQEVGYFKEKFISPEISFTFLDAGHILGSAIVDMRLKNSESAFNLVFSGDLGRPQPILNEPSGVRSADYLVLESTYGDREHVPITPEDALRDVVLEVVEKNGCLLIPSFAVGRSQEILYIIRELEDKGKIPVLPVYMDSPMAIDATEIFMQHTDIHNLVSRQINGGGRSPLRTRNLHICKTPDESKALNNTRGPAIILSADGMATGGRVLHHLLRRLPDPNTTVLFVGYQAEGTRGRLLTEGATEIKIFGELIPVRAKILLVDAFSAHADRNELMVWLKKFKREPGEVFIVHGEPPASMALAESIKTELNWQVRIPALGETDTLKSRPGNNSSPPNPLLEKICRKIRRDIIMATTTAGSGHPSSSLSAVELMATLFFDGHLKYDLSDPKFFLNDRVIFSKGHASPLYYSLFHAAGVISVEELLSLRKFGSRIEGHPTPDFPYCDVSTGSLGQGLSVGVGMALALRLRDRMSGPFSRNPNIFVLLGDSEMSEGQIWEAIQLAAHYKLNHLVGILDVNRLGQRGETMPGWDITAYEQRLSAFGWETITLDDGHDLNKVHRAFDEAVKKRDASGKPLMIIARTVKGKGISFMENLDGWHGKPIPKERLDEALGELGDVDMTASCAISVPGKSGEQTIPGETRVPAALEFSFPSEPVSTREAYGDALSALGSQIPELVVLDAETSNSTYAEKFKKNFPERFFEMYIAEQNMVSCALGFSKLGFIPFVSTFAAFLTRAFDQIRMTQYSEGRLNLAASHAGVSIGQDGSSQMGLEDLAMVRSLLKSAVLYPADGISAMKLVGLMAQNQALAYIRTTRDKTPVLYSPEDEFHIGGSMVLRSSEKDVAAIFSAGITLHEALKAHDILGKEGIPTAVIDLYSVKPIDQETINKFTRLLKKIVIIEDHSPCGGIGEAVLSAIETPQEVAVRHLAVSRIPHSGTKEELLRYEEIDALAIVEAVKSLLS
ncbi:MAG: transketolase [bacterium]